MPKVADFTQATSAAAADIMYMVKSPFGSGDDRYITFLDAFQSFNYWYNVLDYGALGDGVTDDTLAIQAAIDAAEAVAGTVYFPRGTYMIRRQTELGGTYRGCLSCDNYSKIRFMGDGNDASTIKLSDNTTGNDLHMFLCDDANYMQWEALTLDGNYQNLTLSNEQAHGIETNGGNWFSVINCNFYNHRGDGIRFFGNEVDPADYRRYYYMNGCNFIDARRSGIGVQRQYNYVWILNCYFDKISDQAIDFEPSGSGGPSYFVIDNNIFERRVPPSLGTRGRIAITLSGIGSVDPHLYSRFTNNIIKGGTVQGLSMSGLVIANNHIEDEATDAGTEAGLYLFRYTANTIIANNVIVMNTGSNGMTFALNSGVAPENLTISNNTIIHNGTAAHGIYFNGATSANIQGNTIISTQTLAGSRYGINIETNATTSCEFIINDNRVVGEWTSAVRVRETSTGDFAKLVVMSNSGTDTTNGVRFENGPYTCQPIVIGNEFAGLSDSIVYSTGQIIIIGGNAGDIAHYQIAGGGAPTFSATKGSVYHREDGSAGTMLYVNTDGGTTWSAYG